MYICLPLFLSDWQTIVRCLSVYMKKYRGWNMAIRLLFELLTCEDFNSAVKDTESDSDTDTDTDKDTGHSHSHENKTL